MSEATEPATPWWHRVLGYAVLVAALHWVASRVAVLTGWPVVLGTLAFAGLWTTFRMFRARRDGRRFFQVVRAQVLAHQTETVPAPDLVPESRVER